MGGNALKVKVRDNGGKAIYRTWRKEGLCTIGRKKGQANEAWKLWNMIQEVKNRTQLQELSLDP